MSPIGKLLSHRLRGFGPCEHSPAAMIAACASESAFLEVDIRASRDGELFLWHDHRTGTLGDIDLPFATTDAKDLSRVRHRNGEAILGLREALQLFSTSRPGQKLCLDIKDFGFEERCLQLVREAKLESRVCFVSWTPQTLLRLWELQTSAPLMLACCNLLPLGPAGRAIDYLLADRRVRLGWLVMLGRNSASSPLGPLAHGFQHGFFCREIPAPLLNVLAKSGGGLCVHRWLARGGLTEYCRNSGLQLWVFSTQTTRKYLRYASNPGIDVIFCDDALAVITDLKHAQA
jgi:glycerophosphoryl diester phosphodiesterase